MDVGILVFVNFIGFLIIFFMLDWIRDDIKGIK